MCKPFEHTPEQRADAERLGAFCTVVEQQIFQLLELDVDFAEVLTGALIAEFTGIAEGLYPPAGHTLPRVDHGVW